MKIFSATIIASAFAVTGAVAGGMLVGGYAPADSSQPEIAKAAQFAVAAMNALPDHRPGKLKAIRKAEQQVVAGMNYRMCLSIRDKRHGYRALAIVYKDLAGKMTLTEWTPKGC